MWVHLLHRHVLDTVVILEEGNPSHPQCTRCEMLVPRRALKVRHPDTAQCARGADWKRRRIADTDPRESLKRAFEAYGDTLENVAAFRYLGWVLTAGKDEWLAVVGNLGKARKSWGRLSRILIREGAYLKVLGHFYKTVAQAVLRFGAETWVLTPRMERAMGSFQHRVARWIIGRQPRIRGMGPGIT